jgi:large subunit ribosomal protein L18
MRREDKVEARLKRKKRMKWKLIGNPEKPRLLVFRSLRGIYAQLIDDATHKVLTGASTVTKELRGDIKYGGNVEAAKKLGQYIGKKALEMGFTKVVFDRNGFRYHGRVKALADGAREAGLIF